MSDNSIDTNKLNVIVNVAKEVQARKKAIITDTRTGGGWIQEVDRLDRMLNILTVRIIPELAKSKLYKSYFDDGYTISSTLLGLELPDVIELVEDYKTFLNPQLEYYKFPHFNIYGLKNR